VKVTKSVQKFAWNVIGVDAIAIALRPYIESVVGKLPENASVDVEVLDGTRIADDAPEIGIVVTVPVAG
jgi:hypothetical protein